MEIGIVLIIVAAVYFFPTIVAFNRGTTNAGGVFIVNLLLGWTLVGWGGALMMAAGGSTKRDEGRLVSKLSQEMNESTRTVRPTLNSPSIDMPLLPADTSVDQLVRLADLHKQGVLTDEEFAAKKKQLLER